MRPIKQSNSMKELLKKLKRHDTLVLASGVVAASLLCGAFVYVTTPAISADAAQEEVRRDSLGVQKKASDQLKEIENYLERLDKVVTDSQELVKEVQTVQNEQKELTEKTIETQKTTQTEKNTNNNSTTNSTKVVEKINGLDKALDSIHSEIQATNTQIKELKSSMDKGGNKDSDKDKESFAQITNALNDIKKSCDKSGTDVSGIVEQLKSSNSDNSDKQKSMISSLETIVKSLEKVETKETLSRMETELKDTQSTYVSLLDNVEKSVSKTTDSVKKVGDKVSKVAENVNNVESGVSKVAENVSSVESGVSKVAENVNSVESGVSKVAENVSSVESGVSKVADDVNNVGSSVSKVAENVSSVENGVSEVRKAQESASSRIDTLGTDIGSVKDNLKEIKTSIGDTNTKVDQISQRLEEVFQYSNSSRKKLASVLFDICGYEAAEDATFNELIDQVKHIPEHVMNSKSISYERHYHKDGSGKTVQDRSLNKGGCFTKPVYHSHTSACYATDTIYVYAGPLEYQENLANKKDRYAVCVECQKGGKAEEMKNHTHETTDKSLANKRRVINTRKAQRLVCTKNGSSVEYWLPGCGFTHGEITKAVIVFNSKNSNAKNNINTSMISESKNLLIDDAIFNFDIDQDPEPYDEDTENYNENGEPENNENNENAAESEGVFDNEGDPENTDNYDKSDKESGADQNASEQTPDNSDGGSEGENEEMPKNDDAEQGEDSAVSDGNSQS